jgi:ABC-type polysaccharide/polyol phosphate export permease
MRYEIRVIGALLMREILTRYGRHNIGFMWLFVEPMMFTLGVLALWTSVGLQLWRRFVERMGNEVPRLVVR